MKKSLALFMTLIFCVAMFAGISVSAFSDVTEEHRHSNAITYLTEKEVVNGYEDGSFKPESTITRAEFVKMMLELLGFGNIYGDQIVNTGFNDVDAKAMTVTSKNEEGKEESNTSYKGQHWAAGYIKLAVDKKIVNGYGDGRFGPDDPVKYEEAIKMIVCCLGREEYAQTRAKSIGKDVWPDGYLSIGNDLMVAKNTEYLLGNNASRSNVAQMLYNIKDVPVILAPTVTVDGVGGGGGSSGPNILGGGNTNNIGQSTTIVSGLIAYGQVVAAVKQSGESLKPIIIDDNIVIDGQPVTSITKNYIIVKFETPVEGEIYAQFYTSGVDYSNYLGQRTKVRYRYNPDGGRSGRYEIEAINAEDTEYIALSADQIKEETKSRNENPSQYYLYWTDGNEDYDEPLFTDDLDTLTVIYNNRLVDVDALGNDPAVKSDVITIDDFMPDVGKVILVNAYEDNTIDLVWIETYETYVVGTRNFNTSPKSITDKFRTTDVISGETTEKVPEKLILDDSNSSALRITQDGTEKKVTDIATESILMVAKSKCGTSVDITIEKPTEVPGVFKTQRTNSAGQPVIEMSNGKTYPINKYFTDNVESTLEYEMGDTLTLYLNKAQEVVWAKVEEVKYSVGYLTRAVYVENAGIGELSLEILTSGGQIKPFKMADTNTKYITKATNCLSSVTPSPTSNPNGSLYKNLDEELIFESLKENAALINYGEDGVDTEGSTNYSNAEEKARKKDKPSSVLSNATTAQPIMYTVSSGDTLSHLVTYEPDVTNRFTGTSLKYETLSGTGERNFSYDSISFSAASGSTFIFVPNNRQSSATAYKIGTSKLVEYMQYNIEPFYTTNSAGVKNRTMFVVYNENIDAVPTYRSDNMVVSNIKEDLVNGDTKITIKGQVGSSTKEYTTNYTNVVERAYVLDENFDRKKENGQYVRREVEVGDVIRVGYFPAGTSIASIDIILDVSETAKAEAPKVTAIGKDSSMLSVTNPSKILAYYYARIGEIVAIDPSDVKTWCDIKISDSLTSRVTIGTGFSTKQILLYDHTIPDDPGTEKDERLTTAKMGDLWGSEMLYIWQGDDLNPKQIYAVRYPATQP